MEKDKALAQTGGSADIIIAVPIKISQRRTSRSGADSLHNISFTFLDFVKCLRKVGNDVIYMLGADA